MQNNHPQPGIRPQGQQVRFGVPPAPQPGYAEQRVPPVQIPQHVGAAPFAEQTPAAQTPAMRILQGGVDNPFHPALTARLEKTICQLVSRGTLETHLTSVHREINPKMAAWYTKATYLLDINQEADTQVAHLLSACTSKRRVSFMSRLTWSGWQMRLWQR